MTFRIAVVAVSLLTASVLSYGTAWACSCAMQTPEQFVAATDGPVFVGTLVDHEPVEAGDFELQGRFTFAVERVLVGELRAEVTILAATDGAACGLGFDPGTRVGLKLYPDGNGWTSDSCSMQDPDALLAVAEGEPPIEAPSSDPPPSSAGASDDEGSPWLVLGVTAGLALASVLGIVAVARRRKTAP